MTEDPNPPPGEGYSQVIPEALDVGEESGTETRCSKIVIYNGDRRRDRAILFGDGDPQQQWTDEGSQAGRIHHDTQPNDMEATRGQNHIQVSIVIGRKRTHPVPNPTSQFENCRHADLNGSILTGSHITYAAGTKTIQQGSTDTGFHGKGDGDVTPRRQQHQTQAVGNSCTYPETPTSNEHRKRRHCHTSLLPSPDQEPVTDEDEDTLERRPGWL